MDTCGLPSFSTVIVLTNALCGVIACIGSCHCLVACLMGIRLSQEDCSHLCYCFLWSMCRPAAEEAHEDRDRRGGGSADAGGTGAAGDSRDSGADVS